ncbi:hypothetical protein BRD01_10895 [Halobacteriales archaeon QS_8_65_32]|nr:MAG: hypothetical protein BRD01_10895 [Halobacteriales archaeon QS_8_65_32]
MKAAINRLGWDYKGLDARRRRAKQAPWFERREAPFVIREIADFQLAAGHICSRAKPARMVRGTSGPTLITRELRSLERQGGSNATD